MFGSEQVQVTGSCEHNNEPLCPTKCKEFLDWVAISFSRKTLFHGVS